MTRINLVAKKIPKDYLLIQKQAMVAIVASIVAVFLSIVWIQFAHATRDAVKTELEYEKSELEKLKPAKAKNKEFNEKMTRREEIIRIIGELQSQRIGPRPFLDYLNTVLPPDIWLTRVKERKFKITVSGYSFSSQAIANLMRLMEKSKHFKEIKLSEIQRKIVQKEKIQAFTVTATWGIKKDKKNKDTGKKKKGSKKKKA